MLPVEYAFPPKLGAVTDPSDLCITAGIHSSLYSRNIKNASSEVKSLAWSPPGLGQDGGCVLGVTYADGITRFYQTSVRMQGQVR